MKVYVVQAFDAEPYSYGSWVHGIYDSKEKAEAVLGSMGEVFEADEDGYGGYMLSRDVEEIEVQ